MNTAGDKDRDDVIASAVSDVRARIERRGQHIGGHETRTRVLLIDPILKALGWDVLDPDIVEIETPNEDGGRPDYVLKVGDQPRLVVEAKALGKLNVSDTVAQVAEYIYKPPLDVVAAAVFTDGEKWRFHDKPKIKNGEQIAKVTEGEVYRVASQLNRSLARWNFGPDPVSPPELGGASFAIDDDANFPPGKAPTAIRIGDDEPIAANGWSGMYAEVAKYVVLERHLVADQIPLQVPGGTRYLINRSPVSSNGTEFTNKRQFIDGLWIDTWGGRQVLPGRCVHVLRAAGIEPSTVQVRFD